MAATAATLVSEEQAARVSLVLLLFRKLFPMVIRAGMAFAVNKAAAAHLAKMGCSISINR